MTLQFLFPADYIRHIIMASVGVLYYYGGKIGSFPAPMNAPNGKVGYDCSGYAQAVLRALGLIGHGVDWMSAAGMHSAATPIPASEVRAGDVVFYSADGVRVCHVTVAAGPVNPETGIPPIVGANGGGTSTLGNNADANVRYDDSYWGSAIVGYGRFSGYGCNAEDYLLAIALYVCWATGITRLDDIPGSPEIWDRVRARLGQRDPVDYTGTLSLAEVYAPLLAMNDGRSTWREVTEWVVSQAGSALDLAAEAASDAYEWVTGGGEPAKGTSTADDPDENEPPEDEGWFDWLWAGADDAAALEDDLADDSDENDDGGWW